MTPSSAAPSSLRWPCPVAIIHPGHIQARRSPPPKPHHLPTPQRGRPNDCSRKKRFAAAAERDRGGPTAADTRQSGADARRGAAGKQSPRGRPRASRFPIPRGPLTGLRPNVPRASVWPGGWARPPELTAPPPARRVGPATSGRASHPGWGVGTGRGARPGRRGSPGPHGFQPGAEAASHPPAPRRPERSVSPALRERDAPHRAPRAHRGAPRPGV